jgi:hypothetical protein
MVNPIGHAVAAFRAAALASEPTQGPLMLGYRGASSHLREQYVSGGWEVDFPPDFL